MSSMRAAPKQAIDLDAIRRKLDAAQGPNYWRSLEEVANTAEFQAFIDDEFPSRADEWKAAGNRREMLRLMGAAFALAGLTGCTRQPEERILPYVKQPEEVVLGRQLFYATAMPFRGTAVGLLVESHEGRPTKIEGNPQHPSSLGRTLPHHQAATLGLYDPDRSQAVLYRGRISSWGRFLGEMAGLRQKLGNGTGLRVLSEPIHSPTLQAQRAALLAAYPGAQWHEYDAIGQDNALEGARLAFGQPIQTVYQIDKADVILSLDADFLVSMPGSIAYARSFASRRHAEADRQRMNRLYVVEPTPSLTGAKADHCLPMKAKDVEGFARAVAAGVGVGTGGSRTDFAAAVARDLGAHRGTSLVIAGDDQPPAVHALAHAMNQALGNVGATVVYTDVPAPSAPGAPTLSALVQAMKAGQVQALVTLGVNPVYTAPADYGFTDALGKVPMRVHLGSHLDETGVLSTWHVPEAHFLESWSDAAGHDGTVSIIQPLIAPLYEARTAHEVVNAFTDRPDQSSYQTVKNFWQSQYSGGEFQPWWEKTLHDGFMANTALPVKTVAANANVAATTTPAAGGQLEIVFRPDPNVWDGRFANNGWLQECPKPITKITWDNAAYVSPATAQRLGVENEDQLDLKYRGRTLRAPVWVVPGQADDSVTVFLGYGRTRGGRIAEKAGYSAYSVRTSDRPYFSDGLEASKAGGRFQIACTQTHHGMEGRDIVRSGSNAQFLKEPHLFHHEGEHDPSAFTFYPEWKNHELSWGMAIDQNACIGCNACLVACVAENNIPVVGKDQVARGREMHWIRVDRYYSGGLDRPETHFQPVPCMHCEAAPCEPVCPVAATVHSGEGLNQMVYNRCIGTRYCSNNCPYKVRRFNFYLYQDFDTQSLYPLRNPEVSVRSRGVMEKCTYCVQRIERAKIDAEREDRHLKDGDVQTACQTACPTDAIAFGNISDPSSRVSRLKKGQLNYSLLAELGTKPRTTYLAKLRNPNPELEREG